MFIDDSNISASRSVRSEMYGSNKHGAPDGAQASLSRLGYKHVAPPEQDMPVGSGVVVCC